MLKRMAMAAAVVIIGFVAMKLAFMGACRFLGHSSFEMIWSGWAVSS